MREILSKPTLQKNGAYPRPIWTIHVTIGDNAI